jgi:hypothetical protein
MANYWQPKIDKWLETVNINNTPGFPTSYQYAPAEGEEQGKVFVTGHGKLTLRVLKNKINDIINDVAALASSEDLESVEKLHHSLFSSSDLENLLKQYIEAIRNIRASKAGK